MVDAGRSVATGSEGVRLNGRDWFFADASTEISVYEDFSSCMVNIVGHPSPRTISAKDTDLLTVLAEARTSGSLRIKSGNEHFTLTYEKAFISEDAKRFLRTGGRVKSDD